MKNLKINFMAVSDFAKYVLVPIIIGAAGSLALDMRILGLSANWSAYTVSFLSMLAGIALYDHITSVKALSKFHERQARIRVRSEELLAEGRRAIELEEAQLWWSEHEEEINSWREAITGYKAEKEAI